MKALENKLTGILNQQPEEGKAPVYAKYSDLIASAVNNVERDAQGFPLGLSPTEMRKRLRIIKAIDKSKDDEQNLILLEDHDADTLVTIIKRSKWPYMDQAILDLEDDINGMKYETEVRKEIEERPAVEEEPLKVVENKQEEVVPDEPSTEIIEDDNKPSQDPDSDPISEG